jgi:diaminopimelate epimerase
VKGPHLRLGKFHGLGNDFLVALETENPDLVPDAELARSLCNRRTGVGADGLIFGMASSVADLEMVLINSDGSPAEISGNGIRCLVHAHLRSTSATPHDTALPGTGISVDTPGGIREVRLLGDPGTDDVFPGDQMELEVDMGGFADGPEPTAESLAYPAKHVGTVDIGNPHLVLVVDDPWEVDLQTDGSALEAGYPEGINVHFVSPREGGGLDLRVWERGAGITEACGSGAVASVLLASRWGLVNDHSEVHMPGGVAVVERVGDSVTLAGPSEFVAEVITP